MEEYILNKPVPIANIIAYEVSDRNLEHASKCKTVVSEYPLLARNGAVTVNCKVDNKWYKVFVNLKEELPHKVIDAILYSVDAYDFTLLVESALKEYLKH